MKLKVITVAIASFAVGTWLPAQSKRPMSPPGEASVQVVGKWVKPTGPSYAMGGERYEGGKWIDIVYNRPLLRGRKAFEGTGKDYGKSTIAQIPGTPKATVWRAGADVSTRFKTEVPLIIGGKTIPPGEYTLFIDLKRPAEWTFIVSNWRASPTFKPANKDDIYGAFGYSPAKDLTRAAMKVDTLPFTVEELTWQFIDMTRDSGRIAILWDRTMASVPFKVGR